MRSKNLKQSTLSYPKKHLLWAACTGTLVAVAATLLPSSDAATKRKTVEIVPVVANQTSATQTTLSGGPQFSESQLATADPANYSQHTATNKDQPGSDAPETDAFSAAQASSNDYLNWPKQAVRPGDTLSHLFKRAGLSSREVHQVVSSGKEIKQLLTSLKPGQTLYFQLNGNQLNQLRYVKNRLEEYLISRNSEGQFTSRKFVRELTPYARYAEGTIDSSLFLSAKKAGLSEALTMELANIFGWDIDFALDIRSGDQFRVIYEELYLDGEKYKDGAILGAEFVNQGKTYTAIRFETSDRGTSYFSPNGDSMRKAFLRSPISFARISSHFNLRRRHPVLHTIRAHKGTDYAAATGTPIKATGNGKVIFRGWKGGYGRVVIIQHGQKYRTLYAHMSKFRKGVKTGTRVKQGQVIGYVGKSGLATGPHLHYEFYENGRVRNPVTVKLPNASPVSAADKEAFLAQARDISQKMKLYASSTTRTLAQAD